MAHGDSELDIDVIRRTIDEIDGAWDVLILTNLGQRWVRSGQLRRQVSRRLDYRVFTDTMTRLADRGLVQRRQRGRRHVEYRLTERGQSISQLLGQIEAWGKEHPPPSPDPSEPGPSEPGSSSLGQSEPDRSEAGFNGPDPPWPGRPGGR